MHGFLILCLAAATTADQLGYNYKQNGQIVEAGGIGIAGNDNGEQSIDVRFNTNSPGAANAPGGGFGGFDNTYDTSGSRESNINENRDERINERSGFGIENFAGNTEFNKEFYTYSAPEEDINEHENAQKVADSIKKNLRVIFIKAPENQAITNAALQLAKQASEDQTAIYVLTKQANIGELANQLQTIKSTNANKPEVHFVKYRTPEEALHAQQVIQAQYDALGGPSHSSKEGVAPVLNFATPAVIGSAVRTVASSLGEIGSLSGNNGYLPPAFRRA